MKIDQTKPITGNVGESNARTPAAKSGGNPAASTNAEGTSVHLGSTSKQMQALESSVASASVVDSQKVAEIKLAISEGRFQVNTGVVADKLISTVRDLISASQR